MTCDEATSCAAFTGGSAAVRTLEIRNVDPDPLIFCGADLYIYIYISESFVSNPVQ